MTKLSFDCKGLQGAAIVKDYKALQITMLTSAIMIIEPVSRDQYFVTCQY